MDVIVSHLQVFAACTDNENKMVKMKASLREKYPKMMIYECSTHLMNLFKKDASPKQSRSILLKSTNILGIITHHMQVD